MAEEQTQERRSGDDRRQVPSLSDPRFLFSIVTFVVGIVGGVFGSWVTMQIKTTRMESAATQLQDTAREIKTTVGAIQSSVQSLALDSVQLKERINTLEHQQAEEKQDRKQQDEQLKTWIDTMNIKLATIQAREK